MEPETLIEKIIAFQKAYRELYGEGLVGVGLDYVQVIPDIFVSLFPVGSEFNQSWNGKWLELNNTINGTKFLTLLGTGKE